MSEEEKKWLFKAVCMEYRRQSSNWREETVDGQTYEELNELETRLGDIMLKEVTEIRQRAKERGETIL